MRLLALKLSASVEYFAVLLLYKVFQTSGECKCASPCISERSWKPWHKSAEVNFFFNVFLQWDNETLPLYSVEMVLLGNSAHPRLPRMSLGTVGGSTLQSLGSIICFLKRPTLLTFDCYLFSRVPRCSKLATSIILPSFQIDFLTSNDILSCFEVWMAANLLGGFLFSLFWILKQQL